MTNASTATIPRARLEDYAILLWKEVISITTGSRASPEGLLSLLPKELQGIIGDEQYCLRIFSYETKAVLTFFTCQGVK